MDTLSAFAMGEMNRHRPMMVFDWIKAARIIKERKPTTVCAGLHGDWEYTGGEIYANRAPVPAEDTYVYLASTWAVPEIEVDGDIEECYKMQPDVPGWDAKTYWPEEAKRIIEED